MIAGIGVDILRESRVEPIWTRHREKFAERILCDEERQQFDAGNRPVRFLTKAFAVKEAFVKAFGTGFEGVSYRDVGSVHDSDGRRRLVFSERLQSLLNARRIHASHLSLSDEGGLVCAMVVLEIA